MAMSKRITEIQERKKKLRTELDEVQQEIAELETETAKAVDAVKDAIAGEVDEKTEGQIAEALDELEAKIEEITEELDALAAEEEELREKKESSRRRAPGIVRTSGGASEAERRGRDLRQQRAVTVSGGTLVRPVGTAANVNGQIGSGVSSIVDLVKMEDRVGMSEYQVPYVVDTPTAQKTAENAEAPTGDVTFAYASIKPVKATIYSEISREAMKLNNTAYYDVVIEAARKALRKQVSNWIVNSDAASSPSFVGILAAAAIGAANDLSITGIDQTTLRRIAFQYGGDEDIVGDAVLFLNKKDLVAFGDVRGTQEKKAVYEITPDTSNTNTGIIKDGGLGVRYCLNNNIPELAAADADAVTMFYGAPTCYEMGLFSDFDVRVSEDAAFRRGMLAVLGEVMVGGNVVVKDGFVRIKKGA